MLMSLKLKLYVCPYYWFIVVIICLHVDRLDRIITHCLSAKVTLVVGVGFSDHFCVCVSVSGFIQQDLPELPVTEHFVDILCTTDILPTSCDLIVDSFTYI